MSDLNVSVTKLYGVGKVRAAAYERMGVHSVYDLLLHYPRGYENRADVRLLSDTAEGAKSSVLLTVATEARSVRLKAHMTILKFRAFDESGTCEITYFNQDFLKNSFPIGSEFRFYGYVGRTKKGYTMASPAFELYSEDKELPPLVPVYPLTEGLSAKQVTKDMQSALSLAAISDGYEDYLPEEIRRKHSLPTIGFALKQIHMPESFSDLARARKRLIFDELFIYAAGMTLESKKSSPPSLAPYADTDTSPLEAALPYKLTSAQKRAIDDIRRDMQSGYAMSRMVVGDVGCGKTVVSAAAIYIAVKNGMQAALMAPTEILATQHFGELSRLFEGFGIRCGLLVGSLAPSAKAKLHRAVAEGELDVLIGTQALISEGVSFARAGLVVADEQHRFGVGQRASLAKKCGLSHMLVMSATPIPRSLALAMYGNLSISRIDEMPLGRQRVDTYVVNESYRERLNAFIRKQTDAGGRVYIVCPAVEEHVDGEADVLMGEIGESGEIKKPYLNLKSAIGYAEELRAVFPDKSIALLHGKMKGAEKDKIMRQFVAGGIDILVSTTVIEVGVNVPEATLMIVENAERFGLSQLHQLRGRVGRGTKKSYCVLVSEDIDKEGKAKERLLTMKTLYDGFEIAERDLLLRGPGDFLRGNGDEAIRQSGGVKFRLAELCGDAELMRLAFEDAREIVAKSPDLSSYPALKQHIERMFTLDNGTVN